MLANVSGAVECVLGWLWSVSLDVELEVLIPLLSLAYAVYILDAKISSLNDDAVELQDADSSFKSNSRGTYLESTFHDTDLESTIQVTFPEPVFVPLKVSDEELLANWRKPREAPVFTLFTIYEDEEGEGETESVVDLSSFGAKFEPIRVESSKPNCMEPSKPKSYNQDTIDWTSMKYGDRAKLHYALTQGLATAERAEEKASKLLKFSDSIRFARSNCDLSSETSDQGDEYDEDTVTSAENDEIKTRSIVQEASAANKDDEDFSQAPPPPSRPRTPDFVELLRRNMTKIVNQAKVPSIFDEEPPDNVEVLDEVDDELMCRMQMKRDTVAEEDSESQSNINNGLEANDPNGLTDELEPNHPNTVRTQPIPAENASPGDPDDMQADAMAKKVDLNATVRILFASNIL